MMAQLIKLKIDIYTHNTTWRVLRQFKPMTDEYFVAFYRQLESVV